MTATSEELISRSQEQLATENVEAALSTALAAVNIDPTSSDAWWQLALVRLSLNDLRNAIIALRKTVEIEDDADGAWARLGWALSKQNDLDGAKKACSQALILNPDNLIALETISNIQTNEDNKLDDETYIDVLERLEQLRKLTTIEINRLGILHYRAERPLEAIKYWRQVDHDSACLFNLGLAYSHKYVSQDADAVDTWRQAITISPNYDSPKLQLEKLLPRLRDLREKVLLAKSRYQATIPYEVYLNPFDLLNITSDDFNSADEVNNQIIMRHRKRMLQELELEEGSLFWVPGLEIDKSRAIRISEELLNDELLSFHWMVLCEPALHRFLTHCDVEHFLVSDSHHPQNTLAELSENPKFKHWLGEYFCKVFDRTLAKAVNNRDLPIIECMLDGRRWVTLAQEEKCFENSRRSIERLLEPLEELINHVERSEPSKQQIIDFLDENRIIEILNFLPMYFEDYQSQTVDMIRRLCLKIFKHHQNSELSRSVMGVTDRFHFKSAAATATIADEIRQLDEIIEKEKAHETRKTSGSGSRWEITKSGVRDGNIFFAIKDIVSFASGVKVTQNQNTRKFDYLLTFEDKNGHKIGFHWVTANNSAEQQKHFDELMNAALHYILPHIVELAETRLKSGSTFKVGSCRLDAFGLHFETKGWFKTVQNSVPWVRASVQMQSGDLIVQDSLNSKAKISMPLRETGNAFVLLFLTKKDRG